MTEQATRDIFLKNYFNSELNDALMSSMEEIFNIIFKEGNYQLNDTYAKKILVELFKAKSRINLFIGGSGGVNAVQVRYLSYLDHIRETIIKAATYLYENHEVMDSKFRKSFTRPSLKMIAGDVQQKNISESQKINWRGYHTTEIKLYKEFINVALGTILGREQYERFAEEYDSCIPVLNECKKKFKEIEKITPQGRDS